MFGNKLDRAEVTVLVATDCMAKGVTCALNAFLFTFLIKHVTVTPPASLQRFWVDRHSARSPDSLNENCF